MKSIVIRTAFLNDLQTIREVVAPAWRAVYGPILSSEQVEFMLVEFYNPAVLTELLSTGKQEFILLFDGTTATGFAAFEQRSSSEEVFKLNKLYLLPETKGKGFGRLLMEEVIRRVALRGGKTLELNVNRYNDAQHFYAKMGFEIAYEEDIAVGEYFMNDFVMRRKV